MPNRLNLLQRLPQNSVGAELGVFQGTFSAEILFWVNPSHLYLVDLFDGICISGDQDGENKVMQDMAAAYTFLQERFQPTPNVSLVKDNSVDWLQNQQYYSLDWVYIDTDHSEKTTMAELRAALPVVKRGGFIAGHDFHRAYGVMEAVTQFTREFKLPLELFTGDQLPSYLIQV